MSKTSKPTHYTAALPEVIDVIDWAEHTQALNYAGCNAIKYMMRARLKGSYRDDLAKAYFYLGRAATRRTICACVDCGRTFPNLDKWRPFLGVDLYNAVVALLAGRIDDCRHTVQDLLDAAAPREPLIDGEYALRDWGRAGDAVHAVTANAWHASEGGGDGARFRVRIDMVPAREWGDHDV